MPVNVLNWLEKWISAEANVHLFLSDGDVHNWEQIVFEMAENMKDVSIAYAEAKALELPESAEVRMVVELALNEGIEYLNNVIQPIQNKDFRHLL